MSEIQISATGHLTADPELRFTPSGQQVAAFRVASTPRKRDASGTWVDGETTFLPCEAWGDLAEHIAESLERGGHVLVRGVLRTQRWQTAEGEKRERLFVRVDEIGPSLQFATAKPHKAARVGHTETDDFTRKVESVREQLGGQPLDTSDAPF